MSIYPFYVFAFIQGNAKYSKYLLDDSNNKTNSTTNDIDEIGIQESVVVFNVLSFESSDDSPVYQNTRNGASTKQPLLFCFGSQGSCGKSHETLIEFDDICLK